MVVDISSCGGTGVPPVSSLEVDSDVSEVITGGTPVPRGCVDSGGGSENAGSSAGSNSRSKSLAEVMSSLRLSKRSSSDSLPEALACLV